MGIRKTASISNIRKTLIYPLTPRTLERFSSHPALAGQQPGLHSSHSKFEKLNQIKRPTDTNIYVPPLQFQLVILLLSISKRNEKRMSP